MYADIIPGKNGYGADKSYQDAKHFDASFDTMLHISKEDPAYAQTDVSTLEVINRGDSSNGYMMKWSGTVTAAADGTYYMVGREIDNGFVAFVDKNGDGMIDKTTEKVYEYWAENHWFDGSNNRLYTDLGGFTLIAGTPTAVEFWYLEMTGGDVISMHVTVNADPASTDDKSFADAGLSLKLSRTCYVPNIVENHDRVNAVIPAGKNAGACMNTEHNPPETHSGNCSSAADVENHKYDASITALKAEMLNLGTVVLPNFEKNAFQNLKKFGFRYEDSMIEYSGYMTPTVSGAYVFGTAAVDNCLVIEIKIGDTWTRVYEFWASGVWNDASKTWSGVPAVNLVKDTAYEIRVTYLEINGGEGLSTLVTVDGVEKGLTEVVAFTTEKPSAPVRPATVSLVKDTQEWYYKTSGEGNTFQVRDNAWMTDPAVYGVWDKKAKPADTASWNANVDTPKNNQSIWAVTTFEIADMADIEGYELMATVDIDDNMLLYVNGTLVQMELRWATHTWSLAEEAKDLLVKGTNTIAFKAVQGWGGAKILINSVYLSLDENTNSPYQFQYVDNNGVTQNGRIATADQFLAYVADANARVAAGKNTNADRISIENDLDFEGKEWVPFTKYIGRIFGNGYTFSNIRYTATVNAAEARDGMPVGLLFDVLSNGDGNGLLYDLTLDNCTLTVNATQGTDKGQSVFAGLVAGLVDRGRLTNVTVQNSKIDGNANIASGIAGVASWCYNEKHVYVENCAVINTEINAASLATGILGYVRGGDLVRMSTVYLKDVTLNADDTAAACGGKWGWDGEKDPELWTTTLEGSNQFAKTLIPEEKGYSFYFQVRDGKNNTKDVRIICVATEAWLAATPSCDIKLTFTKNDGSHSQSCTVTPDTVYRTVNATSGNVTDVYGAADGSIIFGWVITDVPIEYASTSGDYIPKAVIQ